jgi:hypothetical protein
MIENCRVDDCQKRILVAALEQIAAMDPKSIRADDLGRAARIAHEAIRSVVGGSSKP